MASKYRLYKKGCRVNTDTPESEEREAAVEKFQKLLPDCTESVMMFLEIGLFLFMICDRYNLEARTDWAIIYTEPHPSPDCSWP